MKYILRSAINICAMPLIMLFLAYAAYAADVWDRPLIGYNTTNNITINITNNYYTVYNDTLLWQAIYDMNTSIWNYINYLDGASYNETNARIANDSLLQADINGRLTQAQADSLYYDITNPAGYMNFSEVNSSFYPRTNPAGYLNHTLKPAGVYLYNDTSFFYINETALNMTIKNISKIYPAAYNMSITGQDINTSSINISFEITQVVVTPPDNVPYRFELTEYPSTNMIDRDRQAHVGVWSIQKNHALNSFVRANISAASSGTYSIMAYYEAQNG